MAYQGVSGYGDDIDGHHRSESPVRHLEYTKHIHIILTLRQQTGYHPTRIHDSDDEDADRSLLHSNPTGPFTGPFDEPSREDTPGDFHNTGYSLSESYAHHGDQAVPYTGYSEYNGSGLDDSTTAYSGPDRTGSGSPSSSTAWAERQQPGGPAAAGGGLRRNATRKVKLVQGAVLSADYPVPSAIQNAVQAKYRNDLESGSEEFTHMRCK